MPSHQANRDRAASLRKLDSAVMLEPLDSTTSSHAYLHQETFLYESADDLEGGDHARARPVTLDLAIRFGRLGVVTVAVIGLLATLTVTFNRGVVIGEFDPTANNGDAQKKLLDDYNSYTGNVAALFGKPIELFVALAVQLVLLRVLTASVLRAQMGWKLDVLALVLSAGVGFLLNNSLNALNVQLQPPKIEPMISAADLSYTPDFITANATGRSTNVTLTVSERTVKNPITNTALRNLVLPRVPVAATQCDWELSQGMMIGSTTFPDRALEYGFAQRDWHGRLLQEALEPSQLRVVVNATSKNTNSTVDAKDLPMSASTAGDLFAYSMFVSSHLFPWPKYYYVKEEEYMYKKSGGPIKYENVSSSSVASAMGVLPNTTLDETAQREWFIRESGKALLRKLNGPVNGTGAVNTSRSDLVMEFSHVEISPTVHFDAFTIEFEVDPRSFTDATSKDDNVTRYNEVTPEGQCGPWPASCLIPKPPLIADDMGPVFDAPAQVQVFGSCVDANGTERLAARMVSEGSFVDMDCDTISKTSFMVVSIGKRFVADAITNLETVDSAGNVINRRDMALVTNLRRIFTYTVAKISWNVSDLTSEFTAQCASDAGSCHGLRFPLAPVPNSPDQKQELIVGVNALPTSVLTAPTFYFAPRLLPLVRLHEPPARDFYIHKVMAGDPLLPHNIGTITWGQLTICNAIPEDQLHQILNNHMYIEHGLQTAYTAATFFLLQNGVVKDVVQLNDAGQHQSLNFQQNKQRVELVASIPDQNAWLTLGGCGVLAIGLCSIVLWSWITAKTRRGRSGELGQVTTPHVVARVLLDSVRFPPAFVQRRVVGVSNGEATVDRFLIVGLALQPVRQMKNVE